MNLNYNKKVKFHTLGCKVNQYETEAASELFDKAGYKLAADDECADVYVINTCTVTNLSDSKSRQFIRRAKRENPDSTTVVMGCYSQVSPEDIEKIKGVDIIIGTTEREKIVDLVEKYNEDKEKINIVRDIRRDKDFQKIDIEKIKGQTRAYIKVQDGCNRFCTYCIIPYARGNIRSRDPYDVKEEVIRLVKNGYKEVVLTGIHIASYGKDSKKYDLLDLISMIHDIEGLERIRLSSVEPVLIDEEFLKEVSKYPKFCDHFHLSLQSGSDTVLERMNRRYTAEEYLESVKLIRKYYPNAGITTDIIVGFPGETEEEFQETIDFVKKVKFSRVHVFKYSPREGTPAYDMKNQVDGNIKNQRSKILIELTEKLRKEFESSFIGETLEVLVERKRHDHFLAHSTNYIEIAFNSELDYTNNIIDLEITKFEDGNLYGKVKGEKDD